MRSRVRFSERLRPKAGAVSTIRSGWGMEARFRSGDSGEYLLLGLPWELTCSSVKKLLPITHEVLHQRRRSRRSSAPLDSTAT